MRNNKILTHICLLFVLHTLVDPISSTQADGSTRHATMQDVRMYFDGVSVDLKSRLEELLRAVDWTEIDGVVGVENINVVNPSESTSNLDTIPTGNNGGNDPLEVASAKGGQETDPEQAGQDQQWSNTLIGVSIGTAVLAVLIVYCCCFEWPGYQNTRDDSNGKSLHSQEIPRSIDQPQQDRTFDHNSQSSDGDESSNLLNAHELILDSDGKVHECNSATCEICAHNANRNQMVHFLPATEEEDDDEMERLPTDARRNYYVNDTVNL